MDPAAACLWVHGAASYPHKRVHAAASSDARHCAQAWRLTACRRRGCAWVRCWQCSMRHVCTYLYSPVGSATASAERARRRARRGRHHAVRGGHAGGRGALAAGRRGGVRHQLLRQRRDVPGAAARGDAGRIRADPGRLGGTATQVGRGAPPDGAAASCHAARGEARGRRRRRQDVYVATKVTGPSGQMDWIRGGPPALDRAAIAAALDGSLRRLQTDYVDLYQLHWPDRRAPPASACRPARGEAPVRPSYRRMPSAARCSQVPLSWNEQ